MAASKLKDSIGTRKRYWADRYVNAMRRADRLEQLAVEKEVEAWNQQARKSGEKYKIVNIKRMVKSRLNEDNLRSYPKAMRERVKGIAAGWQ